MQAMTDSTQKRRILPEQPPRTPVVFTDLPSELEKPPRPRTYDTPFDYESMNAPGSKRQAETKLARTPPKREPEPEPEPEQGQTVKEHT